MRDLRHITLLGLLLVAASHATLRAGDGFPPFGAWAYGSGSSHSHAAAFRGPLHSARFSHYYGWGYSSLYVAPVHFRSWARCGPSIYGYAAYRPSWVGFVYAPHFGTTLNSAHVCVQPGLRLPPLAAVPSMHHDLDWGAAATVPSATSVTAGADPASSMVPAPLLDAADDIMRAGGYRQAARAYAELSQRFGNSSLLYGRRFIAQLLSGDAQQPAIIANLSHMSGLELVSSDLPRGSLQGLSIDPSQIESATELLAAQAIADDDPSHLRAVGLWLHLAGDATRGDYFLSHADQVASLGTHGSATRHAVARGPERSDAQANSEFVSLEGP